jgi:hypothetical protein
VEPDLGGVPEHLEEAPLHALDRVLGGRGFDGERGRLAEEQARGHRGQVGRYGDVEPGVALPGAGQVAPHPAGEEADDDASELR